MFKGASFNSTRECRRRTVAHELLNRLEKNLANLYPPAEKKYIQLRTNWVILVDFQQRVFQEILHFLRLKFEEGNRDGVLLDNFKGYSMDVVKTYIESLKRGDSRKDKESECNLIDFCIIGSRIILKSKPSDLFLGEIIKGFCRDFRSTFMLDTPVDPMIDYLFVSSHYFCATWVVSLWE